MPRKNKGFRRVWIKGVNGFLCLSVGALFCALLAAQSYAWPFVSEGESVYITPVSAKEASSSRNGVVFANITIEAAGGQSLPEAKVLVNGKAAGNFAAGSLTVRVCAGDLVLLDTSAYNRDITFSVTRISANLRQDNLLLELTTEYGEGIIGRVAFK
ncbi:MAG: hypothetical protein FWE85_02730 [Clostridiales bacterium]|nr:hypothetical protein [Clostridiales bacterium]